VPADLARLRRDLCSLAPVVVAFSGGADSAFLAWVANDVLGNERACAVTAVSASLAPSELEDCRSLAREWGLNHREVKSRELAREAYVANGPDRCWHCKDELMRSLAPLAAEISRRRELPPAHIVLGVNLDDLGDYRPGQDAARSAGAVFPLVDAGFTKSDVRETSRALGLRTWDKPAAACLASRVPYGAPVSLGVLGAIASAEAALKALGFRALRVRHYGELARVELPLEDLERALAWRSEVVQAVRSAGYRYVTLDMEGLRSGNLNSSLARLSEQPP
jgi:pyridinium-3,5-biscarboxylic acid mononucleotide sulfurtransferase